MRYDHLTLLPDRAFQKRPFGGMTLEGGKGGRAPDPNPGMIRQAEASEKVGMRALDLQEEYMNWSKEFYDELKPTVAKLAEQEYGISEENRQRAREYADYERETFRPMEQEIVRKAREFDTEAKREELARTAAGDVTQAFGVAREQTGRDMAARGLNPNSGRFAALNQQLSVQEALARAGSQNQARTQAEGLGFARSMDAAGLGRNLAPNASTAYGVSLQGSGQAGNTGMQGGQFMSNAYGQGSNMLGQATSAFGTAGNIYGQEFNARMQGYTAQQQARSSMWQGIGGAAGMFAGKFFADGGKAKGLRKQGKVTGPGGPVDDQVPAMLSDGEYVLPADTVQKIGVKKLDKLVDKTHTPAAVQRARKKRGLRGKKK